MDGHSRLNTKLCINWRYDRLTHLLKCNTFFFYKGAKKASEFIRAIREEVRLFVVTVGAYPFRRYFVTHYELRTR